MMRSARDAIIDNFSRSAAHYDEYAQLQHRQSAALFKTARGLIRQTARVLDVGCGTGRFAAMANGANASWQVLGVDIAYGMCMQAKRHCQALQADLLALPFDNKTQDAVVSSLALQWVNDLPAAFREMARVLKPGGSIVIATLGQSSLHELHAANSGRVLNIRSLARTQQYTDAIVAGGLVDIHCATHTEIEYFASVRDILHSMRRIGAGETGVKQGLVGAARWRALVAQYELLRTPQGLPASWEHVMMHARKPE